MVALPPLLTMGDPAGIGTEIALKAYTDLHASGIPFGVMGDIDLLRDVAASLKTPLEMEAISSPTEIEHTFPKALPVLRLEQTVQGRPGRPHHDDAAAIETSIREAVRLSLAKEVGAVVTNPINKKVLYDAGFSFPGHTEFIADLCAASSPVMMLASPRLRVVPVTIHQSLRTAIDSLSTELIVERATRTAEALQRDFGLPSPRLAISGLNPHAGEDGSLGHEDGSLITPAVSMLRDSGIDAVGPVPGDTLFTPRMRETYDAAICMYHDQALIPIKALDFDRAVNVTLGLPIIRTSPDHGTAYDIAGKGIASAASLISAVRLAAELAQNRSLATAP